jgi:hypothetical protein
MVSLMGLPQKVTATAGPDGKFNLEFNASSGGPYTLRLSSGEESVTATNAMIGVRTACPSRALRAAVAV